MPATGRSDGEVARLLGISLPVFYTILTRENIADIPSDGCDARTSFQYRRGLLAKDAGRLRSIRGTAKRRRIPEWFRSSFTERPALPAGQAKPMRQLTRRCREFHKRSRSIGERVPSAGRDDALGAACARQRWYPHRVMSRPTGAGGPHGSSVSRARVTQTHRTPGEAP